MFGSIALRVGRKSFFVLCLYLSVSLVYAIAHQYSSPAGFFWHERLVTREAAPQVILQHAYEQEQLGNYAKAFDYFQEVIDQIPGHSIRKSTRAAQYWMQGKYGVFSVLQRMEMKFESYEVLKEMMKLDHYLGTYACLQVKEVPLSVCTGSPVARAKFCRAILSKWVYRPRPALPLRMSPEEVCQ